MTWPCTHLASEFPGSVLKKGTVPFRRLIFPRQSGTAERDCPLFQRAFKRLCALLLALTWALTSLSPGRTAEPAAAVKAGEVVVTAAATPLKAGEKTLQTLGQGTALAVKKIQGNWIQVEFSAGGTAVEGWVDRSKLALATAEPISPIWVDSLGIFVVRAGPILAVDLKAPANTLVVLRSAAGSAAAAAGMQEGDVLPSVPPELRKPDGKGKITVLRVGKPVSLEIMCRKHELITSVMRGTPQPPTEKESSSKPADRTIVVARSGGNYRTITAALQAARPGDAIVLRPGLYQEELLLRDGVTVRGDEGSAAVIAGPRPLRAFGAQDASLQGISISGEESALELFGAKHVTIHSATLGGPQRKSVILAQDCQGLVFEGCTIEGNEASSAAAFFRCAARLSGCVVSPCRDALLVSGCRDVEIAECLLDTQQTGIAALKSTLSIRNNTLMGANRKVGIGLDGCDCTIEGNTIRNYPFGVLATKLTGTLEKNTFSQCFIGLAVDSGDLTIRGCNFLNNQLSGIDLGFRQVDEKETCRATVSGNSVQGNGRGIFVHRTFSAKIDHNLVEGNVLGIKVEGARAQIENNTIVTQQSIGVEVLPLSHATLLRNIIAFNRLGIVIDVEASCERESNDVFSNLANRDFPLLDGDYARIDRVSTRAGDRIHVVIYPTGDLKAATDLAADPGFAALGSDYRLKPDSPLARGDANGTPIGAFPVLQVAAPGE